MPPEAEGNDPKRTMRIINRVLVVTVILALIFALIAIAYGAQAIPRLVGEAVFNSITDYFRGGPAGSLSSCRSIPEDWRPHLDEAGAASGAPPALIAAIISGGEHYSWYTHKKWPVYADKYAYPSETNPGVHHQDKEGYVRGLSQFKENTFQAYSPDAKRNGTPSRFGTGFKVEPYIEQTKPSLIATGSYLSANGGKPGASEKSVRDAIYHYNHANWYVDQVYKVYLEYLGCSGPAAPSAGGAGVVYTGGKACPVIPSASAGWGPVRRSNPHGPTYPGHEGLDIFAAEGTPIYSVTDGIVIRSGYSGGYRVMIDDGQGHYWFYQHMLPSLTVSKGQKVTAGQQLGQMSNTGAEQSQVHLHLGIAKITSPVTGGVSQMRWDHWFYPFDFVSDIPCLNKNLPN